MARDEIRIEELELMARVGVPDEERAHPQRLVVNLVLQPRKNFADLADELARTVDYTVVGEEVRGFVATGQAKLIETLAHEVAVFLLGRFPLVQVEVELRKFVLPGTKYVAARVVRVAPAAR
jgi:dihydroneopterin aldolase